MFSLWNESAKVDDSRIKEEVNSFFGELLPSIGYEYRESQHKMAMEITESLLNKRHRVIEAGVGIGKTLAYLVPALIISHYRNKTFLVSTSIISLEEQLKSDFERIKKILQFDDLYSVVIKGQRNYLCELKLYSDTKLSVFQKNEINKKYKSEQIVPNKYSAENCVNKIRNRCKYKSKCFYYKMYNERINDKTNILICNHNYLITVLAKKTNIKDIDFIICDEAHKLNDAIIAYYTKKFELDVVITKLTNYLLDFELQGVKSIYKNIMVIYNRLQSQMKNEIRKVIKNSNINSKTHDKLPFDFKTEEIVQISKMLFELITDLKNKGGVITSEEKDLIIEELEQEMLVVESLYNEDKEFFFYANVNKNNIEIYYVPQDVCNLSKMLIRNNRDKKFIFTSATLTTHNNYDYFLKTIGLDEFNNVEVSKSYISPYDYKNNMLVFLDYLIPNPKNKKKYINNIIKEIIELIEITNGKTLVLFTSKGDLNFVYDRIKNKIKGIEIFKQSESSSQNIIIENFKNDVNSVLLATNFWEGIDIKGLSLSQVIIARLPFPTVNAITQNRAEAFEENIYLNDMLIKVKQGIGRLIRSYDDCGIISILDSRSAKKYKDDIKSCIYDSKITLDIEDVKEFALNKKIVNNN